MISFGIPFEWFWSSADLTGNQTDHGKVTTDGLFWSSADLTGNQTAKDLQLYDIADFTNEGFSVREIEKELGIPKSTVAYRLGVIKSDYPELLSQEVSNCPTCPTYVTDTVTDTVTVTGTDSVTDTETETENDTYSVTAYALSDEPKEGLATQAISRGFGNYIY